MVLLRQPERIFLTTEYLDWYTRHMGVTQVDIVRGRDAVAAMELRRAEARACPMTGAEMPWLTTRILW